jgi:hypothetical protein
MINAHTGVNARREREGQGSLPRSVASLVLINHSRHNARTEGGRIWSIPTVYSALDQLILS